MSAIREVVGPRGKRPSDADCQASCSSTVSLGIRRPRSRAAACSACLPGRLALPSKRAWSRCPRPQGGAVPGGGPVGSLAVLVAASTRAASPGAPRSSVLRSAAPLAVACPSPAVVNCPRAVQTHWRCVWRDVVRGVSSA